MACVEGVNFSALCERFGISPKTVYKWFSRFGEEGEARNKGNKGVAKGSDYSILGL